MNALHHVLAESSPVGRKLLIRLYNAIKRQIPKGSQVCIKIFSIFVVFLNKIQLRCLLFVENFDKLKKKFALTVYKHFHGGACRQTTDAVLPFFGHVAK